MEHFNHLCPLEPSVPACFKCLIFAVLSHYFTVTGFLSHSLYISLTLSAAMRLDAAHTDCSQYNDSPLLTQTHTGMSTLKHTLIPSINRPSVLYSSEYSVQLQMHQLLVMLHHIRGS